MNEKSENESKSLFELLLLCGLSIASALLCVWPEMRLWNRLAVPIFHAPIVTFIQAFGLLTLFSMLKYRYQEFGKKSTEDAALQSLALLLFWYVSYWLVLLASWCAHASI